MSITIGHTTFDRVRYDADADVLYLHVGDPSRATDFDESPEGYALRFGPDGDLVGVTIINAKSLLNQGAPIAITVPERFTVDPSVLAPGVEDAA
jgi:uncharacterized protein YuzE